MAKKVARKDAPKIYKAALGAQGAVIKGIKISQDEAVNERKNGNDVVVCGDELAANRRIAERIEHRACDVGQTARRCSPHRRSGRFALPHLQPHPRLGRTGHTFYETPSRKSH